MTRPFVMVVIFILVAAVVVPLIQSHLKKRKGDDAQAQAAIAEADGKEATNKVRLVTSLVFLGFFILWLALATGYSGNGGLFPKTVGVVGIAIALLAIMLDIKKLKAAPDTEETITKWRHTLVTVAVSTAWVLFFIWSVFAIGMLAATAIFALVFLLAVARMKPVNAVIYTAGITASIWAMESLAHMVLPVGYLQIFMG